MSVPDAAIEAAARLLSAIHTDQPLPGLRADARAAISAAMPAIREAIGEEVEAAFDADNRDGIDQVYSGDYNDGYVYAMELACETLRGGTP